MAAQLNHATKLTNSTYNCLKCKVNVVHSQLAGNVSNRSPLHITTVTVPAVQHYHPWLVPNYTGWWQRHRMWKRRLKYIVSESLSGTAKSRMCNVITSRAHTSKQSTNNLDTGCPLFSPLIFYDPKLSKSMIYRWHIGFESVTVSATVGNRKFGACWIVASCAWLSAIQCM